MSAVLQAVFRISIHAPHAGRDDSALKGFTDKERISIHAPHAGRDKYAGRKASKN